MKTVRTLIAGIALPTLIAFSSPSSAEGLVVDGVAAVVNGEVITLSEVMMATALKERAIRQKLAGEDAIREIKKIRAEAVEELIDRKLIVQEFKSKGLTLPERYVRERIESLIREEFGGDRAAFIKTLKAQGFTLKRFEQMENEKLIVQAMRSQFASGPFVASPAKVQEYYNRNISEFSSKPEVKLRMITIRKIDETGADNRKLAGEILAKIKAGSDFSRMAQLYSEDANSESGGDWGWVDPGTLTPRLTSVAFKLRAGEISDVVAGEDAYFILQVEARREAERKPLSKVRAEVGQRVIAEQKQAAFKEWIGTLRKKAYIQIK